MAISGLNIKLALNSLSDLMIELFALVEEIVGITTATEKIAKRLQLIIRTLLVT